MDKKVKKKSHVLQQRIQTLRQQLAGARKQMDDPAELKLIEEKQVSGGCIVRLPKAYPLYVNDYQRRMDTILGFLRQFGNLQSAGRNGLFRYTSGDWYIDMGIKAAENLLGQNHDLMAVGSAQEYAES